MKIPQLKGYDCIDHDPIDEWAPESDADVFYCLCLHIGPPDEVGADYFQVDVTTPQAINQHHLGRRLSQRGIIVNPYTWTAVLESVSATLELCAGENWDQQSAQLAKHFSWEFENYRP